MSLPKAVIFGCKGSKLLPEENEFFKKHQPLGFILFKRNCEDFNQIRNLVQDLKSSVRHSSVPVLIDQEGGRVVRLTEPLWRKVPPAKFFGQLAENNLDLAAELVYGNAVLIGQELQDLGINVNCAPCVDLLMPDADPIIGDRAFSKDPKISALLSFYMLKGLQDTGITPVIKHLPGHGRAPVDSHEELPFINNNQLELSQNDFTSFRIVCNKIKEESLPQPWGMTAHAVYSSLDKNNTSTQSSVIIKNIIRTEIGFEGFLISDCLTMKALKGPMHMRAQKALEAGCDAVLHCKGDIHEMEDMIQGIHSLSSEAYEKLKNSFIKAENKKIFTDLESKKQKIAAYLIKRQDIPEIYQENV